MIFPARPHSFCGNLTFTGGAGGCYHSSGEFLKFQGTSYLLCPAGECSKIPVNAPKFHLSFFLSPCRAGSWTWGPSWVPSNSSYFVILEWNTDSVCVPKAGTLQHFHYKYLGKIFAPKLPQVKISCCHVFSPLTISPKLCHPPWIFSLALYKPRDEKKLLHAPLLHPSFSSLSRSSLASIRADQPV